MKKYKKNLPTFLRGLDTPIKIQNYLTTQKMNCIEGAVFAAVALWFHGQRPLIMDLKSNAYDYDHVIALYKKGKYWGAISKTRHAVLRYRDAVYASPRELAMSYFHEYFTDDGIKTLRSYSDPFDLSKIDMNGKDIFYISRLLDRSPHHTIVDRKGIAGLRKADPIEIAVGKMKEW